MSIPTSVEAIAIIILIFIPGYVFLQFTKGAVAFIPQALDARYFFAVIVWGGLIHAVAVPWTLPVLDWYQAGQLRAHSTYVLIWGLVTLILGPLTVGILGAWFIKLRWINKGLGLIGMDYVSRTPSAWNYATKLGASWVRVHLKDGTIIGGIYEDSSFADDAGEKDLYLERVYNLNENGDFEDVVAGTAGVWIPQNVISHIMFFNVEQEVSDGDQNTDQANSATATATT